MADPRDLKEAADAIRDVRRLPAIQRHKELDEPLGRAEEWARKEFRKVSEEDGFQLPGDLADRSAAFVNGIAAESPESLGSVW